MINRLKQRWNITSNVDFVLILTVFSLAGMAVSFLRRRVLTLLGLSHATLGIKVLMSILLIVPLYQLSTLIFAFPLGQFDFFLDRRKYFFQ